MIMKSAGHNTKPDPSKSQRKRDVEKLQRLGESLTALTPAQLGEVDLPPKLLEAVLAAQSIKQHSALRRQRQYIGKLMRSIDPEPIRQALEKIQQRGRAASAKLHRLESLRDSLIREGDAAIGRIIEKHPHADRQHLRQLARKARAEQLQNTPPHARRALFRYLRDLAEA